MLKPNFYIKKQYPLSRSGGFAHLSIVFILVLTIALIGTYSLVSTKARPEYLGNNPFNYSAANARAKQFNKGSAKVGYAVSTQEGVLVASYNSKTKNYSASITKALLLVSYLRQHPDTNLSTVASSQLERMIIISDNNSANWVYNHINGPKNSIKATARAGGMTSFKLNTSDQVYILGQSKITSKDFAKFFAKIDLLIPIKHRSYGMGLLANVNDRTGLLKAGIPGRVYSKEGWKPEPNGYVVNQAAQFKYSNNKTYGIAVTVNGTTNRESGEYIIRSITSALIN